MARHVGIAQSVLASWENGRIAVPGLVRPEAALRWLAVLRFLEATSEPGASREASSDAAGGVRPGEGGADT
jgi:hypothetical protein